MSRSLSWFDEEALRKLLSGAGVRARPQHGVRAPMFVPGADAATPPSTLVGQFGHANRFADAGHAGMGRFAAAASTQPGPPPDAALPLIVEDEAPAPKPFNPKATRLAAGSSPPPRSDEPVNVGLWVASSSGGSGSSGTSPPPNDQPLSGAPSWLASDAAAIFRPPSGASIEEKVESYLDWAMRVCGAFAGFVADRQGLPLAWKHPDGDPELASELGAICAAIERGWSRLQEDALAAPAGHAVVERRNARVLVVWALPRWESLARRESSGERHRLYAALCVPTLPAQAAILFAAEAFRALWEEGDHG
jgi:hypothetical protein